MDEKRAKVELSYNPYTMDMAITFNGRKPFVNSLVENYEHSKLQSWIDCAPQIISDEMNGFNFDIDFIGTQMDFEQLKRVFERPGIPNNVSLYLKNELDSRQQKTSDIEVLLQWLRDIKNDHFNNDEFRKEYSDVFDEEYTFYTLHMEGFNTDFLKEYDISVINIDSIDELDNVYSLENTPIFLLIDEDSYFTLADELKCLFDYGALSNQLFFLIKKNLQPQMVKRVIQDLGIQNPQIIDSESDALVKEYFFAYPVTDRIYKADKAFHNSISEIEKKIESEKHNYSTSDKSISKMIGELSNRIKLLKTAYECFKERDNIELPSDAMSTEEELISDIKNWKRNKVKINADRVDVFAYDYNYLISNSVNKLIKNIDDIFDNALNTYLGQYKQIYTNSQSDDFYPEIIHDDVHWQESISFESDLLELKDEQYVQPKADMKELLFGSHDENKELVKQITYSCEKWREYVSAFIIPKVEAYIQERYQMLLKTTEEVAVQYLQHIEQVMQSLQKDKDLYISQLSENESKLQDDLDWISTFKEYVNELERR